MFPKKFRNIFVVEAMMHIVKNYAWKILCTRRINYSPLPLIKQKTSDSFEPR